MSSFWVKYYHRIREEQPLKWLPVYIRNKEKSK